MNNERPTKTTLSASHIDAIRKSKLGKPRDEATRKKISEGWARRRALKAKSIGVDAHLSEAGGV